MRGRVRLSIVVTGRNDDYGGFFLDRFRNCIDSIPEDFEIIVVEWNPPADAPTFSEIDWLVDRATIYTVSPEIHQTFPNHDRMSFYEFIAKNAGIRRATGEWVLSTNSDIIFSREMCERLRNGDLNEACFYRADRRDIPSGVGMWEGHQRVHIPTNLPLDLRLDFCERSVRRVCEREDGPYCNASGDFMLMSKRMWTAMQGYPEWPTQTTIDAIGVMLAIQRGLQQVILNEKVYHQGHTYYSKTGEFTLDRPITPWGIANFPAIESNENWGLAKMSLPSIRRMHWHAEDQTYFVVK
jgi:hypothetical protein